MKNLNRVAFVATLSMILSALAISNVLASPGLGLSDYKLNETITVSSAHNFAVARLYNVGDSDLVVNVKWVPNGNTNGLIITAPDSVFLKVDESQKIYIDIEAKQVGEYSGVLEFVCESVAQEGVSSVTPGGTTNYIISVVNTPIVPAEEDATQPKIIDSSTDNQTPAEPDKQPETPVILPPEDVHNKKQTLNIGAGLIIVMSIVAPCSIMFWRKRRRRQQEY